MTSSDPGTEQTGQATGRADERDRVRGCLLATGLVAVAAADQLLRVL